MLSYKRRICSDTPRWPELVWPNRFPQAAVRPRDVAKQRQLARTSDQLERQARGGFRVFVTGFFPFFLPVVDSVPVSPVRHRGFR